MLAVLCMLLIWSMFIVFSIMAPFIIQVTLGLGAAIYGWLALLVGVGFFVGNTLNNLLLRRLNSKTVLILGLWLMLGFSILFIGLIVTSINIWTVMTPIFFIMVAAGLAFPNLYPKAISSAGEYGGLAGALIGSLILLGAVIITALITQLHAHSPIMLAFAYLIMVIACLVINFFND